MPTGQIRTTRPSGLLRPRLRREAPQNTAGTGTAREALEEAILRQHVVSFSQRNWMHVPIPTDFDDGLTEAERQELEERNRRREEERAERRRQERNPMEVKISVAKDEDSSYFLVSISQNGQIRDQNSTSTLEEAYRLRDYFVNEYGKWLADRWFSDTPNNVFRFDFRADRRRLNNPTNRPGRVDRRARRPQEDTVREDGLVLDIDPNLPDTPTSVESIQTITLNGENLEIAADWDDELLQELEELL